MFGKEKCDAILKAYRETLNRTDCYVHGDTHVFNILVEGNALNNTGDVAFVDWEMSHCGPIGKDLGFFQGFPLACALAHAMNGDTHSSGSILHSLDNLWKEYSTSLETDLDLADVYRQVLGLSCVFLMGYSRIGFHMEYLPIDDQDGVGPEDLARVRESLGIIGLNFLSTGFFNDHTMTLLELQNGFHEIVNKEISSLLPKHEEKVKKMLHIRRRSSVLRKTGQRVSDAHIYATLASEEFCVNDNATERAEQLLVECNKWE
jgi:hypothetical protein